MRQLGLFDSAIMPRTQAFEITKNNLQSLLSNGIYPKVACAYSGGKDSTTVLTVLAHLVETKQIPLRPQDVHILFADTRLELPPLYINAMKLLSQLGVRSFNTQVVQAELDHRLLIYILGRGVPPPSNSMRYCTSKIKIIPMMKALDGLRSDLAPDEKLLMLTGVRIGESAARDQRISTSCSKSKAECGQGWLQNETAPQTDTYAPILHWRLCHVWDWLMVEAPALGYSTEMVADAYGGDEALEIAARTGCMGCPLASRDVALDYVLSTEYWSYVKPVSRLRSLYTEWRNFANRHQKNDFSKRQAQKGPLTLEARLKGLEDVLAIQNEVNLAADRLGSPRLDILNAEEEARIRELISLGTYPNGWDGTEPTGDVLLPEVYGNGAIQPLLWEVGA
jgi:DNA sulfur modification protein DndC